MLRKEQISAMSSRGRWSSREQEGVDAEGAEEVIPHFAIGPGKPLSCSSCILRVKTLRVKTCQVRLCWESGQPHFSLSGQGSLRRCSVDSTNRQNCAVESSNKQLLTASVERPLLTKHAFNRLWRGETVVQSLMTFRGVKWLIEMAGKTKQKMACKDYHLMSHRAYPRASQGHIFFTKLETGRKASKPLLLPL